MQSPKARKDTIVVGIGNPLRQDDRAGIEIAEQLGAYFGESLAVVVEYEPDICLAERISAYAHLIIVDAIDSRQPNPFIAMDVLPGETFVPDKGVSSHSFNWGMILAMARDVFGNAPQTMVVAVTAENFGISEKLSPRCEANAQETFKYLIERLAS